MEHSPNQHTTAYSPYHFFVLPRLLPTLPTMSTPLLSHNKDSSTSSLKLQSIQEFIQFLQEVQVPSSSTMQRWQTAGSVTVPMDWQTFCDIKKLLNEECGYAYRKGTLTLEPPRARFSAQQSVSSAWSLKASILAHLVEQLSPYSKNGTSSGAGHRCSPERRIRARRRQHLPHGGYTHQCLGGA